MPGSRHSGPPPGPLANLPRPLDERDGSRRRRRVRRAASLVVVGGLTAGIAATLANGPLNRVGEVQGAVATPAGVAERASLAPSPTVRALVEATPRPSTSVPPAASPTPAPTPAPADTLEGYRSPLPHGRLTLPFGPSTWGSRLVEGKAFHDGIDIATFCGDRIKAAHDGKVLAAGRRFDTQIGWVGDLKPYFDRLDRKHLWATLPITVVIDDGNGYRSIYAHFSKVVVKRGQTVKAGQLLGYEGATGRASGCHLHYGLFSPLETGTFAIEPDVVKRMKVPRAQIARIDPLLVLPQHRPRPRQTPTPSP
ncbi:MAG TPA: M23 family metallopeptidase [Candidatus Limnocylindrales bacterium]|nr:M23 family metallopeptidase [Candidatus Limnocylindrales bacterium]